MMLTRMLTRCQPKMQVLDGLAGFSVRSVRGPPPRVWNYTTGTEGDAVEHDDGRRHLRVARYDRAARRASSADSEPYVPHQCRPYCVRAWFSHG